MTAEFKHGYAAVDDGVKLHYVEVGQGPLVVLLHGFPEFWFSWRHQLPALARAGFRAVAPDMRGYNLSDKPRDVNAYRTSVLARDVGRLLDALKAERASVIGHDWGGAIAWTFAVRYPERLDRLVILNAPHPATFLKALKKPDQLRRSWYMFFFQLPWLPEAALRAGNFMAVRRELPQAEYVQALRQPGALTATINYYRAMFRRPVRTIRLASHSKIEAPVLIIWGQRDKYLGPRLAVPDPTLVPNARVERLDASHWVQLDQPDRVNALLLEFLKG